VVTIGSIEAQHRDENFVKNRVAEIVRLSSYPERRERDWSQLYQSSLSRLDNLTGISIKDESWFSPIADCAFPLHLGLSAIVAILALAFYRLYPEGPREEFILSSFPNLLAIYITFLSIFLAVVAFLLAFLESKRASLLSQKLSEKTPDYWIGIIDASMKTYREKAAKFLRFAKVVIATFAAVILLTVFAYSRTGWAGPSDPILIFSNYVVLLFLVIAVSDVLLTLLFFKF